MSCCMKLVYSFLCSGLLPSASSSRPINHRTSARWVWTSGIIVGGTCEESREGKRDPRRTTEDNRRQARDCRRGIVRTNRHKDEKA